MKPLLSLVAVVVLLTVVASGASTVVAEGSGTEDTVLVDLRIWQNVGDAEDIWVSARPAGGDWGDLGTFPLEFEGPEGSLLAPENWFYWLYGKGSFATAEVVLAVSQDLKRPDLLYASTCSFPPDCGLVLVELDDGHGGSGAYRYGDISLAVPIPPELPAESERLLLEDRDNLLALRDRLAGLAGYERTLNWHPALPMEKWTGVTIGGSPPRVTKLDLPSSDLRGGLSGLLGELTGLTALRLDGNHLDGSIPSKLAQLENLTDLYLAGNRWEGCVVPLLRRIPNNDLQSLGLPDCPPPVDGSWGDLILVEGVYRFDNILFDVPSGAQVEVGFILDEGPSGLFLALREESPYSTVWITVFAETFRWARDGVLAWIDESVWRASDEVLSRWTEAWEAESAQDAGDLSDSTPSDAGR